MRYDRLCVASAVIALAGCANNGITCGDGTVLVGDSCVPVVDGVTDTPLDGEGDVDADSVSDPDGEPPPAWGARLHGIVWGPNRSFPVSGALVAAYITRPDDILEYRYCEPCVELPPTVPNTLSGPDGSFELELPAGGHYFITVQKGQFRRIREYDTPPTIGDYDLAEDMTTLPSIADQPNGDMIPHIALAFGDYDAIEDVLGKAGIGAVDVDQTFAWGSESDIFDVYSNDMDGLHGAPLMNLLGSPGMMAQYHIIFFPCSYNAIFEWIQDTTVIDNLKDYVRRGGKVYVSDYAYTVVEYPWPEFIFFDDPVHGSCSELEIPSGCNHGPPFDAPSRSPITDMSAWLLAVDSTVTGTLPYAEFETRENWDNIGSLASAYVGDDTDGMPVYMEPKVWVEGIWNYDPADVPTGWDYDTYHPFTVSWPYGCGRVLFTTYHTVGATGGGAHSGFYTQELILWYLIMELQVCQDVELF